MIWFFLKSEMEWREREKACDRSCPNECKVSHGGSLFLYPKKFRPTSRLVHAHWRISARFYMARQKIVGIVSHARVFQFSKTWRYFSFVLWIKLFLLHNMARLWFIGDWNKPKNWQSSYIFRLNCQNFPATAEAAEAYKPRYRFFRTLLLSSVDEGL
jgi:hypothetical protein